MEYKCQDCDAVFEGSSYTTECSSCESKNFEPVQSEGILEKVKKWIKENKLVAIACSIFLILMMCGGPGEGDDELENIEYDLMFDTKQSSNYCMVYLLDRDNKRVKYSNNKYDFLNLSARIEDDNGNSYRVLVNKNKIEYCTAGFVTIEYKTNNGSNISLDSKKSGTKTIESVNPTNINKGKCIPNITLGNPKYNSSRCKIIIPVIEGKKHAYISINGKNGSYQSSNEFNSDNVTKSNLDVWYYAKGFENSKMQYDYEKGAKKKLLQSIIKTGSVSTLPISESEFKAQIIKMINLLKNNKDSDNIWYSIIGYFNENNPPIKIGDRTATIFELQSEIQQHLDSGGNLKSLDSNISVNGSTSSCGGKSSADYVINISL